VDGRAYRGSVSVENRIDQAIATKAQLVATACPYCLQMFNDAIKAKQAEETFQG